MKALILNSGMGSRMGDLTKEHPKCMTEISEVNSDKQIGKETIVSRQIKLLSEAGVKDIVMTTGRFDQVLMEYCDSLPYDCHITYAKNPIYDTTNYIYSIYMARDILKEDDIILMHGDLVFTKEVLDKVLMSPNSCMTVSSTLPLPEKDFKAVITNMDDRIEKVGIEFFDHAYSAQPLYKIQQKDWLIWLENMEVFCERDERKCYAENAFNEVSHACRIVGLDVKNELCCEIDTPEDREKVMQLLRLQNYL